MSDESSKIELPEYDLTAVVDCALTVITTLEEASYNGYDEEQEDQIRAKKNAYNTINLCLRKLQRLIRDFPERQ
jgi:ABC-type cobalt transport system substrate-binding protein